MAALTAGNTYQLPCRWEQTFKANIPPNAVEGGQDSSGETLYIGRVRLEADLVPGKVVPSHECCYVAWGTEELRHESYEILVSDSGCEFIWAPCKTGEIPTGALQGGLTSEGERLYIGRAEHDGSKTIGKVQLSHKVCYIPYGGEEIPCEQYEVLCCKSVDFAC